MEPVRIEMRLTRDDYMVECGRLSRRSVVGPAFAAYFLVIAIVLTAWSGSPATVPIVILGVGLLLWSGAIAAAVAWWTYGRRPDFFGETGTAEFDDGGIAFKTSVAESRVQWGLYRRAVETPRVWVLSTGAGASQLIPKRDVPDAALTAIRAMFAEKGLLRPATPAEALRPWLFAGVGGLIGLVQMVIQLDLL